MWLPIDIAVWLAVVLGVTGIALTQLSRSSRLARAEVARSFMEPSAPVLTETAIVLVLYAAWRRFGEISIMGVERARVRGRDIWHFERWLHLPNEATIQNWCRRAPALLRFANWYYIVAHVLPLGAFLVWMFFRHRDRYPAWRNILALSSLVCAAIQLIPVAPPRMYPEFGFIDAGAVYGPRVYDANGQNLAGQLAAMPSMHVAWSVVIGVGIVRVSTNRWRWLALLHPALTVYAVTVTGYHWLLDGIVGGALVAMAMALGVLLRPVVNALPLTTR